MKKWVMVFGVFDTLHPGHRSFLRQAERHGGALLAVVARDSAVRRLKERLPKRSERVRAARVRRALGTGARVVLGDRTLGAYTAIRRFRPAVICVGYDQEALYADLRQRMRQGTLPRIRLRRLKPYAPHRYHSSFIG